MQIAKTPPAYQFPVRPRCTPRRAVNYIAELLSLGLMGGWGFGGMLGVIVVLLFATPIGFVELTGWWRLMLVTGPAGVIALGYVGSRAMRNDSAERDDIVVATTLYMVAGGIIGAPALFPLAFFAAMVGVALGTIPGIILWLIYGIALVFFTVRRYSPTMDVAAFRRDARRLAALTTWLTTALLGTTLYLLFGNPTSSSDVITALGLLVSLATLTAPFAWWHSKFLIDWWLNDIARSGSR